jgi:predicted ester cyclase
MRHFSLLLSMVVVVSLGSATLMALPPVAAQEASPAAGTPCPVTTEDENEALVRRYIEEAWNQGNVAVLDDVWAERPDLEAPVTQFVTRDDYKARILEFRTAFPDLRAEVRFVLTEDDAVVVGVERTGTHRGEFDGIPATG